MNNLSRYEIWVEIGPQRPLIDVKCLKIGQLSDETANTEALYHSGCGTIKIPPSSEAMGAEHRLRAVLNSNSVKTPS